MAKRKRTVSLSFVLLRFAVGMLTTMLFCVMLWFVVLSGLEQKGIICSGSEINHQVETMLGESSGKFTVPDKTFPGEYVLYDTEGQVLQTNVREEQAKDRERFSELSGYSAHLSSRTYADGSTALIRHSAKNCLQRKRWDWYCWEPEWWHVCFFIRCGLENILQKN